MKNQLICPNCGSKHLNVYKHSINKLNRDRVILRYINCLDCHTQVGKRVELLPLRIGA